MWFTLSDKALFRRTWSGTCVIAANALPMSPAVVAAPCEFVSKRWVKRCQTLVRQQRHCWMQAAFLMKRKEIEHGLIPVWHEGKNKIWCRPLAPECWGALSICGYCGQEFSIVTIHIVNVAQDVKSDNTTPSSNSLPLFTSPFARYWVSMFAMSYMCLCCWGYFFSSPTLYSLSGVQVSKSFFSSSPLLSPPTLKTLNGSTRWQVSPIALIYIYLCNLVFLHLQHFSDSIYTV